MLARVRRLSSLFACFFALSLFVASSSCKKTRTPTGPRACASDADCVVACESRTTCCRNPYCEDAQHAEDAREIGEENQKRCTKKDFDECPVVGARMEVDYRVVPKCRASACIIEKVPK